MDAPKQQGPRPRRPDKRKPPKSKQAAYRHRLADSGLCPACGKPAAPFYFCDRHREDRRNRHRANYAKKRAAKSLCVDCGKPSLGKCYCTDCKNRRADSRRKRRARNKLLNGIKQDIQTEFLEAKPFASTPERIDLELSDEERSRYEQIRKNKEKSDA